MQWLIALGLGFAAGIHISTWGMYKDAPHEGFGYLRYFRSTIVGALAGLVLYPLLGFDLSRPGDMAIFFGGVYVVERMLVEFYKTFLREEDQSKYFIPMQFHVMGKVVKDRKKRILIGIFYASCVAALCLGVIALDYFDIDQEMPLWLFVLVGSTGGWISAFGGAWKDGPIEGFELLKFFRSPAIAAIYALLLSNYTSSLAMVTFPALGYTIATTETYKTFFFPSKPRGKFAGMPIHFPEMLERRKKFVPIYVAVWIVVLAINATALT